jgi:16S rRNA (cytosine967-C5)-methyltransferase
VTRHTGGAARTSSADARGIALDVLVRVAAGDTADRTLDCALREARPEARERALATELVYGVLRRRGSLDALLAPHSSRPLDSLDDAVRSALRLGAYQIAFLDRVPAHAAVDATVRAVKRHRRAAAGFVNAVLRALLRAGGAGAAAAPDPFVDVPAWWAERWRARYGEQRAAAWFAAAMRPSPLVVRPHPRVLPAAQLVEALAGEGVALQPARHAPGALVVQHGNPMASPLLQRGVFAVRGEASQLVAGLLPVPAGGRVLDACAGRGGKTLQIAEDSDAAGVVAIDRSGWRAAACRRDARAAALREVAVVVGDMAAAPPLRGPFDTVLVDAPCSGLGTVRRRPELKWRATPARIERLARLQAAILDCCAGLLAPGGELLYVTCSTEPEENEQVVAKLVARRDDLAARPLALPAGLDAALVGADGCLRTYPDHAELDGFFAARLVKVR